MKACLAYPGDLSTPTGGYVYDAAIIAASDGALAPLALPAGFPAPSPDDLNRTKTLLEQADIAVVDGLAYGALPADLINALPYRPVALCHHPLGYESGLSPEHSRALIMREKAALALAAHVIVTSDATAQTLVADFGVAASRVSVAPPGLAPAPLSSYWAGDDDSAPPVILTVASLTYRKAHDVLINALSRIDDLHWRARWVGPDDREDGRLAYLSGLIAETGLSDRIEIVGACDQAELQMHYHEAALFCLPSRYEGYGMVFDEAMVRGLPVVACNGGAVADVVPTAAGALCAVDDAGAVAGALKKLLLDKELAARKSNAARHHALSLPGWNDSYAIFENVIQGAE